MEFEISILIYLSIILISTCAFHVSQKNKWGILCYISLFFAVMIPVFFAGVRYSIGTDYFSYIDAFELIRDGVSVRFSYEFGFVALNALLAKLHFSSQSILFWSAFIMMSFIAWALFNKRNVLSIGAGAFTFLLVFYQSSFNIVRLMIAVSIFLYNITNIEKRKLWKYMFYTVLAASFHMSALITAPLYFVFQSHRIEKSLLRKILLYGGTGFLILYFDIIFEPILSMSGFQALEYYGNYIGTSDIKMSRIVSLVILYLPMLIPGVLYFKQCKAQERNFYIYYSLMVLGVVILCLSSWRAAYFHRISEYFLISSVILVPIYMRVFTKRKNYLLILGYNLYLLLYWLIIYFVLNNHATVPYQWIL